jgi:addiction module HigA family antidote
LISGLPAVHPGELLREDILPTLDISKAELARRLLVPHRRLDNLLAGRQAVSAPMALRLGRLFGNGPTFWLDMQQLHDLKMAQRDMAGELAAIEPIAESQ